MKKIFSFDLETFAFTKAQMSPKPVCLSYKIEEEENTIHLNFENPKEIFKRMFEGALKGDHILVGHHVSYDMCCFCAHYKELIPIIFELYEKECISDTQIRQKLIDIATGNYRGWHKDAEGNNVKNGYHLADLLKRLYGVELPKPEGVRTGYGDLWNTPIKDWGTEETEYALNDVIAVDSIYKHQEKHQEFLYDQYRQAKASFALQLASNWGVRTHRNSVETLYIKAKTKIEKLTPILKSVKLLHENGKRNLKEAIKRMEAINADGLKTKKGNPSVSADACKNLEDPAFKAWTEFVKAQNILAKDIPLLAAGVDLPIHTRFEELVESGRTSSSNPNIQNMKREPGLRECIVPREGNWFLACDFDKAELHALAQICIIKFGESKLAKALNAGRDPHLELGAKFLGITYKQALEHKKDPEVKKARQSAKAYNFGLPGGLGAETFREFAKMTYGVEMTKEEAEKGRNDWFDMWPEMKKYFDFIGKMIGPTDEATMTQLGSRRIRGGCSFTVACNTLFQGLCADFAKEAMFYVAKEEYTCKESPLFGCRTVNFIHDELLVEVPADIDLADAAAKRLKEVMEERAKVWTPDVPVRCTPTLMKRWSKNAEPTYSADGKLIPWEEKI